MANKIFLSGKFYYEIVLAGTSNDGLILKSLNGDNFININSEGKGNPLGFNQLLNKDVLYCTDDGWVINYTQGTNIKVSNYAIKSICQLTNNNIWVGDYQGNLYDSSNNGISFSLIGSDYGKINKIISTLSDTLLFTDTDIWFLNGTASALNDNFTCAISDNNGFVYAGTNNGHIWKNTVINDFSVWTDLGQGENNNINTIFSYRSNFYFTINKKIYDVNSLQLVVELLTNGTPISVTQVADGEYFFIGDNLGCIYKGIDFSQLTNLGQQFSQSSIDCLINYNSGIKKPKFKVVNENLGFNSKIKLTEKKSIPEIIYTLLAGASPDKLILSSVDGVSWNNEGSVNHGNPLAFCEISNGDILYTTDEGYVVNYTKETSVKVSNYPIRAISLITSNESIVLGDDNGDEYESGDNGETFDFGMVFGYTINQVMCIEDNPILFFTVNGIYSSASLVQSGNFTCATYIGSGIIYAGTTDGHIWESTNSGTSWVDLGQKVSGNGGIIYTICKSNYGNRILYYSNEDFFKYTDDFFDTLHFCSDPGFTGDGAASCISISENIWLISEVDKLFKSIDNGVHWTNVTPEYSQSSINCLISI